MQYPLDFNMLSDFSAPKGDSLYLLIKSELIANYTLCQMRSYLNPHCSTEYNVSSTTYASIGARCEDPHDTFAYAHRVAESPGRTENSYRDILTGWSFALSQNTGVSNGNASINRQLSQFIRTVPALNATMPSLAEALAALSGCTLITSTASASYNDTWNNETSYQGFYASISSQQYTSGPQMPWQNVFYIILATVFAMNLACLGHLLCKPGTVTDFTEPQNLFALAVNSPSSGMLSGACGAGPMGKQLDVGWKIKCDEGSKHFYIASDGTLGGKATNVYLHGAEAVELRSRSSWRLDIDATRATSYNKLSGDRHSWI